MERCGNAEIAEIAENYHVADSIYNLFAII